MRSRGLLLSLLLAWTAGCASTPPPAPASTVRRDPLASTRNAPPSPVKQASAAAAASTCPGCPPPPSWARCSPDGPAPGCGYIAPGPPPPPQPGCDQSFGMQCADGQPPVAGPAPAGCTISSDTPCGLGPRQPGMIQFAVIGDWGDSCCQPSCASFVANMIKGWNNRWPLDFIMTTGDNFYPDGSATALAASMPMYDWIHPQPVSGQTPTFFPTLGNHDFYEGCCAKPYQDYFQALGAYSPTGTPRYYKYSLPGGLIDLFSLNADASEPDGITPSGKQAQWLQAALAQSTANWKIVFFHEPPFSSHVGGTEPQMDWPFASWGATLVLTGHVHAYERIVLNDFTYVTNGLGGVKGLDNITPAQGCTPTQGSQVVYDGSVGAMIGVATASELRFCMIAVDRTHPDGVCIDNFSFKR
jgi:Calcineurin-like phosphoesterase